jgi:hypothetical protein
VTGTPAMSFQSLESDSLDLPPAPDATERLEPILSNHELNLELAAKRLSAVRKPKACNCFHGTTLATVARKHPRAVQLG